MGASQLDIELSKYWSFLSPVQKKSLLEVIKSFLQSPENKTQELQEPETFYNTGEEQLPIEILQQLTSQQKEALITLITSFGIDAGNERTSIEQYNKEIDEALVRMDAGESYTHEQVIEMSRNGYMANRMLRWDKLAMQDFNDAIEYIAKDSFPDESPTRVSNY